MTKTDSMDIQYLLRSLEQGLRAGYSLRQIVERVSSDMEGLDALARELGGQKGLVEAFEEWAGQRPEPEARLVVGTIRLQMEDEGNLADKFGLLHRILERS